jgi:hypothetical protein
MHDYATIWIDFNDDGIFTNNERLLNNLRNQSKLVPTPFTINIPDSVPLGTHRLRIRLVYQAVNIAAYTTDPCNYYQYSETEDYSVTVVPPVFIPRPITMGSMNNCFQAGSVTVDDSTNNDNRFINILDDNNRLVATINANGNKLGIVDAKVYTHTGAARTTADNYKLLNRNISITPEFQPVTPVTVRLYLTNAELLALQSEDAAVTGRSALMIRKTTDECSLNGPVAGAGAMITPTINSDYNGDHYLEFPVSSFSNFYFHRNSSALPVTLVEFAGQRAGGVNKLTWRTNNEVNNKGFEVERSADGNRFSALAFVNSKSESANGASNFNYIYTDEKPSAGTVYYRLKQVDNDGKTTYSKVISIKGAKVNLMTITGLYPNPAKDKINVLISAPANDKVQFAITDLAGKAVMQQAMQLTEGDNNIAIRVANLPSGTYLIKAICNNGCEKTMVRKFIKE